MSSSNFPSRPMAWGKIGLDNVILSFFRDGHLVDEGLGGRGFRISRTYYYRACFLENFLPLLHAPLSNPSSDQVPAFQ